jgi:peptide/nickel transport system substrate-binding protein
MKRRFVSLFLVCCVTAALLLNSCATQTAQTTTSPPATTTTAPTTSTTLPPAKTTPAAEVPKYGGTITTIPDAAITNFDTCLNRAGTATNTYVNQQLLQLDWTRGPAGSGVTNFVSGGSSVEDHQGPALAAGWKMPEPGVWVLQIRQGVRWQKVNSDAGRIMNGREMTADDVVYSFKRQVESPESWLMASQPVVARAATFEKTAPWEVTVKTPVDPWTSFLWLVHGAGSFRVYPREVVAKYGNLADWRNAVGTGPFMLIDYVENSSLTFIRNPDYWEKDPVGPGKGNQLPYVDTFKQLVITDLSTQLAALRTGKLDYAANIVYEDWQTLTTANPKLESMSYLTGQPWVIGMRRDIPGKPFSDIRVRQALMLATDFEAIKRDYFKGQADIDIYPVSNLVSALYQPLNKMPQAVQDLFKYNPDKAKQLLKDAGYPNGFKTSVVSPSTAERVDELSIFKGMWAKVGIDLTIEPKETGVYTALNAKRAHEDMVYRSMFQTFSIQLFLSGLRGTSTFNSSYVNDPPGSDPYVEQRYQDLQKYIFVDTPRAYKAYQELKPYVLEQVFYIPRPSPNIYTIWWPWVKSFYGQGSSFINYFWVDKGVKESMGR